MTSEAPKRRYISPKRAAAVEETDARIIDAAFAVLGRLADGGEPFSLEAVARQAGVTRLTVHNRFGSRRGLLEAVFDRRSRDAGFHRLAEYMALPDPREAVFSVMAFFCDFWGSDHQGLGGLVASGAAETEFRQAMEERNERRRRVFTVLAARLAEGGVIPLARRKDVGDTLCALCSMSFYAALAVDGRTPDEVKALISRLAEAAIAGGQTQ